MNVCCGNFGPDRFPQWMEKQLKTAFLWSSCLSIFTPISHKTKFRFLLFFGFSPASLGFYLFVSSVFNSACFEITFILLFCLFVPLCLALFLYTALHFCKIPEYCMIWIYLILLQVCPRHSTTSLLLVKPEMEMILILCRASGRLGQKRLLSFSHILIK